MVVLHGGGGVDAGQGGAHVDHELVVEAPVVKVVGDGTDEHGQAFQGSDGKTILYTYIFCYILFHF